MDLDLSITGLIGNLVFSLIGMAALGYGKRAGDVRRMALGGALMAFPYFVTGHVALFAVGAVLTGALFVPTN